MNSDSNDFDIDISSSTSDDSSTSGQEEETREDRSEGQVLPSTAVTGWEGAESD